MFASNALSVERLLEFGAFEGPKCKDPVRSSLVTFSASARVQPGLSQTGNASPLLLLVATRGWVFSESPPH